jgi:RES domain
VRTEWLPEGHRWWRIARSDWRDPLDPTHARERGGRWNPPGSFPTLYVNEDQATARLNVRRFIAGWPYEPEDLRDDTGPVLVGAVLPRHQQVADVHTPAGVRAVGLPATYPLDHAGRLIGHDRCQPIGAAAKERALRGVRCRSTSAPLGGGRELAWFPATTRSRAQLVARLPYPRWFWG